MTNHPLDDIFTGKHLLQEHTCRRQFGNVFRITQTIGYHTGWYYNSSIVVKFLVINRFKALITIERCTELMTAERDAVVAPQAREEMHLVAGLLEAQLVVEYLVLIEVTLYQYSNFILHCSNFF